MASRPTHAAAPDIAAAWPLVFDWSLDCQRPETIKARDYWESRRTGKDLPARADLSPAGMKAFMAHVGLIEIHSGPDRLDYFIRLAGSRWEEVFGHMGGRMISEFLPPHIEVRWRNLFDSVRERAMPVRSTTRIGFKNKSWLAAEMFVAPLSEDGRTISMLLMCFTSWSVIREEQD